MSSPDDEIKAYLDKVDAKNADEEQKRNTYLIDLAQRTSAFIAKTLKNQGYPKTNVRMLRVESEERAAWGFNSNNNSGHGVLADGTIVHDNTPYGADIVAPSPYYYTPNSHLEKVILPALLHIITDLCNDDDNLESAQDYPSDELYYVIYGIKPEAPKKKRGWFRKK